MSKGYESLGFNAFEPEESKLVIGPPIQFQEIGGRITDLSQSLSLSGTGQKTYTLGLNMPEDYRKNFLEKVSEFTGISGLQSEPIPEQDLHVITTNKRQIVFVELHKAFDRDDIEELGMEDDEVIEEWIVHEKVVFERARQPDELPITDNMQITMAKVLPNVEEIGENNDTV